MRFFLIFILCSLLLQFSSCVVIKPEPPKLADKPPVTLNANESDFNIPVVLLLQEIEKTVNKATPQTLYSKTGIDVGYSVKLDLQIVRNGNIDLSTSGGKIKTSVPVIINGKARWSNKLCALCPELSNTKEFQMKLTLNAVSTVKVNSSWQIESTTSSDFVLQQAPCISILGVEFCFEKLASKQVKEYLPFINSTIDDAIEASCDLKKQMTESIQLFGKPFPVIETPVRVWSIITPVSAVLSSPVSKDINTLVYTIQVKGKVNVVVGDRPQDPPIPTLPVLKSGTVQKNDFVMELPLMISMQELKRYAEAELVKKQIDIPDKKRKIVIRSVELYGVDSTLIAGFSFRSRLTMGTIYFQANPFFDQKANEIRLRNFKADANTTNVILNKAAFLSSTLLNQFIEKKLVFNVISYVESAKKQASVALANYVVNENVTVSGKVKDMQIKDIKVENDYIRIRLLVSGTMEMQIK